MCRRTLLILQIIICCGLAYGIQSERMFEYHHNFERDSIRNLNLELSKITHQIQIGHDVELDCGTIDDSKYATPPQSVVSWLFKACGHGFNQSSCNKALETQDARGWEKLQCSPNKNCNSSLVITNPTEKDSGLYRCSIYPFKPTLEIQVVKTYFLDVRNTTIPPPDIVDGPRNTTALIDSQVVLQCCVNSRIRPRITWFKRQDRLISQIGILNGTTKIIEYSENIYKSIESAGEKLLTEGVYLSKLILNGVTEQDAGFYCCVALNYGGYKMQEAHLSVLYSIDDESDEHESGIHSLFLLFLIPVGLALAPLSLWICYWVFREQKVKDVDHKINTKGNDYVQVNRNIV